MSSPKDLLNDWMHTPLGGFLSYHAWWWFVALLKLPISLIFLWFSFVFGALKLVFGNKVVSSANRSTKLVVISGCDTGFGRELAILLSKKCGYLVLAGCLQSESHKMLKQLGGDNIFTVPLDVTKDASVDKFIETMKKTLKSQQGGLSTSVTLHALVNNAGILNLGPIDWMNESQFRIDMEVNYFGMIRLTKACLPMMKDVVIASKGTGEAPPRIITVTSVCGLLPFPFMGSYCATKHASEAFTSSLRMEMKAWGIPVVTLNPSTHRTPLVGGLVATLVKCWKRTNDEIKACYGEKYLTRAVKIVDFMENATWDPMNVVHTMEKAVSLYEPSSQYFIGIDMLCLFSLQRMLPSWLMELAMPTMFMPTPVILDVKVEA